MNYIHGVLLLHSAGKKIDEESLTKVINATGEQADPALIKATLAALSNVDISEAIKKAATTPAPLAQPQPKEAEKKEEKKEKEEDKEKKAEEAAAGLGALFG